MEKCSIIKLNFVTFWDNEISYMVCNIKVLQFQIQFYSTPTRTKVGEFK